MEPRWYTDWRSRYSEFVFLGGTNTFDLWFDDKKDVRVVWAENATKWDWFFYHRAWEEYRWGTEDNGEVDHEQVLEEALTYLRLFAPWVEGEMRTGENDYHIRA